MFLLAASCSGTVPRDLADARTAYERAQKSRALELAPAHLHAAHVALAEAEGTYEQEGPSDNGSDRAYIARRKAEVAETEARVVALEQDTLHSIRRLEAARSQAHADESRDLTAMKTQIAGQKSAMAIQGAELATETRKRQEAERRADGAVAALARVVPIRREPRGTVITLSCAVFFATGEAELLPSARTRLDQVAAVLSRGDPVSRFFVEGHTDSRGSTAQNEALSTRRAAAVGVYLSSKGLPVERMTTRGLGSAHPAGRNGTPEGRADNRRVEIVIQPP